MHRRLLPMAVATLTATAVLPAAAQDKSDSVVCDLAPITLRTGEDVSVDGHFAVDVDAVGAFGSGRYLPGAQFNPIGEGDSASTVFVSTLLIGHGDQPLREITCQAAGVDVLSFEQVDDATAVTRLRLDGELDVTLTQTVEPHRSTSEIGQRWEVVRIAGDPAPIRFVRYLDGDLEFGGEQSDGGAARADGATLFDIDTSTTPADPTAFGAIASRVDGFPNPDRWTIQRASSIDDLVAAGGITDAQDGVVADGTDGASDGDLEVDADYDLALVQQFDRVLTDRLTFVTGTEFGRAKPQELADTDGDGMANVWELRGIRNDDGRKVDLAGLGADPDVPDVFVELDYTCRALPTAPNSCVATPDPIDPAVLADLVDRFAAAGMRLHVDAGPTSVLTYGVDATYDTRSAGGEVAPVVGPLGSSTVDGRYRWSAPTDATTPATVHVDDLGDDRGDDGGLADTRLRTHRHVVVAHALAGGHALLTRERPSQTILLGDDQLTRLAAQRGEDVGELRARALLHALAHSLALDHDGDTGLGWDPDLSSSSRVLTGGEIGETGFASDPARVTVPNEGPASALDQGATTDALLVGGPAVLAPDLGAQVASLLGNDAAPRRVAGADRYATAIALAQDAFPGGAPAVVLANGASFPDALAGGPLAASLDAPLLLTATSRLRDDVAAELTRLAPTVVYVLGGPAAVADAVLGEAVGAAGGSLQLVRLAGDDRYGTAAAIATAVPPADDTVYLATGADFPDALAAAAVGAARGAPVLLTRRDRLPDEVVAELQRRGTRQVVVAGADGVVSDAVLAELRTRLGPDVIVRRIAGPDRFATSAALSADAYGPVRSARLVVATGTDFPDALSVAGLAGARRTPLVLTRSTTLPDASAAALRAFAG